MAHLLRRTVRVREDTHWLALLPLCAGLVGGCDCGRSYTSVPAERTALIDGFVSYESPAEVQARLAKQGLNWSVLGDNRQVARGDRRQSRHDLVLSVARYMHAEHSGKLRLDFFNGRLVRTAFYPEDFESYLRRITRVYALKLDSVEVKVPPYTELHIQRVPPDRCVMWADTRLAEESVSWSVRYGD